ncbi:cbb3-type cytochrome c oxidase N-terminal domain-containing protein [Chitinophaga sp. LS1]|uniref:cbb3-type cytochrome c oxidase N-terminal domain-containing protein n=1 Tax=Chitinophaga sp. LS1 TaxID=3051176 RepID=UPI002AABA702|nr:cbb3-type cytochrome c oxidase N-terminal domain-containing protein [Chitinophaga sp. LS1]WPV68627.1 cbb3-type cytochrome c oxidase N-terminal domain-containing protein [Chitinophaga sp. LS1]
MKKRLFNTTLLFSLLASLPAAAEEYTSYKPDGPSELGHPVAIVLLTVIVGLFIAIVILGSAVIGAIDIYKERLKNSKALLIGGLLVGSLFSASGAMAQEAVTTTATTNIISGLSTSSFYLLISVIGLELLVIIALLYALRILVGIKSRRKVRAEKAEKAVAEGKKSIHWLEKLNDTKTLDADSEAEADMGHDYDGIHELNNPTPPWWRYGFYISIVFAVVYLWRFQVAHSAPSQIEELAIANAKADEAKAAYLKNAANNVDENTVKQLTDPADLAAAAKLFASNCAPCHGPQGQGVVGPNLTDDYWLHGGTINKVFTTIKYGIPEKGMKSWKDDFSPGQLAQLASYVKSIHGTNPPNPKEPQGNLEK